MPRNKSFFAAAALPLLSVTSLIVSSCTKYKSIDDFNRAIEKYEYGDYKGSVADYDKAIKITLS